MGRGRDMDRGRPVEPEEARSRGNDPDAVRVERGDEPEAERTGERMETGERAETEGTRATKVRRVPDAHREREGGGDLVNRRDSARWGPIWAGLITALTTFLLLQLLAIGLGLVGIGPNETGGGWVPAIVGLIAFFTGGSVAGMTSAVRGAATGLLNGFLVWALGTVLILLFSALGFGQIFGALGSVVGQFGLLQQGALGNPDLDPAQIAEVVRTGAIGAFFGLAVAALASMLGGFLGGRSSEPIGHMARDND